MVDGTVGFAERMLDLIDRAPVATTYKYALLLGLLDASLEGTDGSGNPPQHIEVNVLAAHVLGLYWPHTDPYPGTGGIRRATRRGSNGW